MLSLQAFAADEVLWRDPGPVQNLSFWWGPGGRVKAPTSPYRFVKEDLSGSKPKVNVIDGRGRHWNVKFGYEVPGECFGARMMWAAGYFIEPAYFVASGRIDGIGELSKRSRAVIRENGAFQNVRFQLRTSEYRFMDDHNWAWSNNPFTGTHEIAGLKILIMLTSNWDNKDARDEDKGVNTAIFEHTGKHPRYIYTFTDWGEILGGWGQYVDRKPWSCDVFSAETPAFVNLADGRLQWGYGGRHSDFSKDITVADIRWSLRYLGRITGKQLFAGLRGSGATHEQAECFARELRRRIDMLQHVSTGP
jgi:hypothetical protein